MMQSDEDMLNMIFSEDEEIDNLVYIGSIKVDFSKKMKLEDYEEGFFVPVNENANNINVHLSLMYKSRYFGCPIICSTGEPYMLKHQLICPAIFNNIT